MNFDAFYKISYGLYIVSSGNHQSHNGYVANTVFQVTAEPPQLAISCSKDNYSIEFIKKYGVFSVSVLKQSASAEIIGRFGYQTGKDISKFEATKSINGSTGVPIVTSDCVAWFECKVTQQLDVGSHIIFVGEVIDTALLGDTDDPLTYAYYRNVKKGAAPKNAPTYIDKSKLSASSEATDNLEKASCLVCGYVYDPKVGDPDGGIAPGTPFEDIPDDWVCPTCGATKDMFQVI